MNLSMSLFEHWPISCDKRAAGGRLPLCGPGPCLEVPGRGHEPETRSDSSGYLVRLSNDARAAREFFHTVGDNRSQLHYRLAQFTVLRNVALNTTEISL